MTLLGPIIWPYLVCARKRGIPKGACVPPRTRSLVLAVCVLVATLASAVVASGAPPGSEGLGLPLQAQATVIQRGDPNRPVVSLMFDAGADRGFAAYILDVLSAEGVRASFGPTASCPHRAVRSRDRYSGTGGRHRRTPRSADTPSSRRKVGRPRPAQSLRYRFRRGRSGGLARSGGSDGLVSGRLVRS